ncbi:hypothetical protein [Spirosoma validum]|uniref:Uncharacterized protein n=1 Tax=Spirosoma validum TaxID=2771355 RepID=A0A927GDN6_9BACT|nr:hypothetical protein [Spirosoma validum]MBD2753761.1 hypothetical protein [Spirosoma validum]
MPTPTPILDIPFNETPGSTVAQDYAPGHHNAQVVDGNFIVGRNHRAARLNADGYAEIASSIVPLSGIFTMSLWIKAEITATGPGASWCLFVFAGENRVLYLDLASPLTIWSYLVIQQEADRARAYVNGHNTDVQLFPSGWGKPIGVAVINDVTTSYTGNATVEDLLIYNQIVDDGLPTDPTDPTDPQNPSYMTNTYYVDGINFRSMGVVVTKSRGMLGNLHLKEPLMMNWAGAHGLVMDLGSPRYEAREITLLCFCYGISATEFTNKIRAFRELFVKPGFRRLMRIMDNTVVLVYEVVAMKSIDEEIDWRNLTATFTLNLLEPEPVKRVLKFSGTGQVSITLSSPTPMNIYWGDNSTPSKDVYGSNVTRTHNYNSSGDHYISVTGVIEKLTSFSSNAQTIYDKF